MPRRSTRRDFLRGRSAADAAAELAEKALAGLFDEPDSYLLQVERRAMACLFQVSFNAGQYEQDAEAGLESLDLVDQLEAQLSVFRETSEISRINRLAAEGPVVVEPRLFALLQLCVELHGETGGAFDITASPLWRAWGFSRREGRIPSDAELADAMGRVGTRHLLLDPEQQTVAFGKPGVEINLGSIGKGYALDRCGERLAARGIGDYQIHGGQSSILVRGSRGITVGPPAENQPPRGWVIGVHHPLRPEGRILELRVRDRGVGTSGSQFQSFRHQGRRYGHILDPRTGQPAQGLLMVTVVAPTASLADGLSTALFVMGPDAGEAYCRAHPEVGAVFVLERSRGSGFEVVSLGLAEDEWRLVEADE